MPARSVLILALLVQWTASSCDPEQLSVCTGCCAMLFSSHECDPADVFRIKVNGNGILGAMWDDVPVAAIVRPGCLLELWDWKNQTACVWIVLRILLRYREGSSRCGQPMRNAVPHSPQTLLVPRIDSEEWRFPLDIRTSVVVPRKIRPPSNSVTSPHFPPSSSA